MADSYSVASSAREDRGQDGEVEVNPYGALKCCEALPEICNPALSSLVYDGQPVAPKALRLSLLATGVSRDHLTAPHHNPPERCLRFGVFSDRHQRTLS